MKRLALALLLLLCAPLLMGATKPGKAQKPAKAAPSELQNYKRAFDSLDSSRSEPAILLALRGRDTVLNKVLKAYYMAQPGNDVPFTEMASFLKNNPEWPGQKGILMIAEQKMPNWGPTETVNWFTAYPPATLFGFNRYMEALAALGDTQSIQRLARARWVESDFSNDDLSSFYNRYGNSLNADDHRAKLDRLLWKNDSIGARRMYAYVDDTAQAVADARLALANQNRNPDAFLNRVTGYGRSDPGLLYERLRWYVRNDRNDEALDILRNAPDVLGRAEPWWDQRNIMIRRSIEQRDFNTAYRLSSDHGQLDNKTITQAEFLAGWLALRFLNEPERARRHFQILYDSSSTPISRSRGAYWLARSYEALGDKQSANQAFEVAAALNTTYYGQLAAARLYANPTIQAMPEPQIPASVRQKFFSRDMVRAVERLHSIGEEDRARTFFKNLSEDTKQRSEFALLTELAYQINRPDLAIEAAKAANQKNMVMSVGGYPILDQKLPSNPEPAFIHALIRQESMFNPSAKSPVGAHGLMQLMPRTAKEVAKKIGIKFHESSLGNSDYNIRLGTTFAQNQLAIFSGSYILALSAYNAGPARARQWVRELGDPRDGNIDPVDWVELIPISETRNYVQRILESTQIYRARLNGGQAPLLIIKDLKR